MKIIHFIVNPIAGSGNNKITEAYLQTIFDVNKFSVLVKYSTYKQHALILTQESIAEGASIIVACGGDGTINEVASCLIGTAVTLGVIPMGSGNGLASNLNIPKKVSEALEVIKNLKTIKIDVGSVNGSYFFSNTGVGFDAAVVKYYQESNNHSLFSYVVAVYKALKSNKISTEVKVQIDNKEEFSVNPFMIFVSNSNEMGYKVSLTPKASLQDGLLDVVVISKLRFLKILWFGLLVFLKKLEVLKEATCYQATQVLIKNHSTQVVLSQMDGEIFPITSTEIKMVMHPNSLQIVAP